DNLRYSTELFNNDNPIKLVNDLKQVYNEIEDYFKLHLDKNTLNLIQTINGDDLLDYVSFDNGFFNLKDIALEEKNYQINIKNNELNAFRKSKGENIHVYSEDELKRNFGESPIKILNDVLNEYDVNGYEF